MRRVAVAVLALGCVSLTDASTPVEVVSAKPASHAVVESAKPVVSAKATAVVEPVVSAKGAAAVKAALAAQAAVAAVAKPAVAAVVKPVAGKAAKRPKLDVGMNAATSLLEQKVSQALVAAMKAPSNPKFLAPPTLLTVDASKAVEAGLTEQLKTGLLTIKKEVAKSWVSLGSDEKRQQLGLATKALVTRVFDHMTPLFLSATQRNVELMQQLAGDGVHYAPARVESIFDRAYGKTLKLLTKQLHENLQLIIMPLETGFGLPRPTAENAMTLVQLQ